MIMKLLAHYLKREARELAENGIRLQIIGDRSRLSPSLCRIATQAERCTAQGSKMVLTLAISYGGQDEIVFGARALAEACRSGVISPMQIDRQSFGRYLPFAELPQVDLLIRTGGEQRISNFLLWQLAYAELLFLPVYWPDFGEYDLSLAIDNFRTRSRRFGKEC